MNIYIYTYIYIEREIMTTKKMQEQVKHTENSRSKWSPTLPPPTSEEGEDHPPRRQPEHAGPSKCVYLVCECVYLDMYN